MQLIPRKHIKIAFRLWIPVLVLRIVAADAANCMVGLSVLCLASKAFVVLLELVHGVPLLAWVGGAESAFLG